MQTICKVDCGVRQCGKLNGPVFKVVSRRRCRYESQKATKDLKYFVDSISPQPTLKAAVRFAQL